MKWIKPNGIEIELNDSPENIKAAEELGLVRAEQPTEEGDSSNENSSLGAAEDTERDKVPEGNEPPDVEGATTLYRRLAGEWVVGEDQPKEVIIESDPFPNELVADALTDGWFRTKQEAGDAPPDLP